MPDTAAPGETQPMGELSQLFTNLAYLCRHDLATERQETTMAQDKLNDVIDKLGPAVDALIADDKMKTDAVAALQAAAAALDASGNVIDSAHADTLRGMLTLLDNQAAPPTTDPAATVAGQGSQTL